MSTKKFNVGVDIQLGTGVDWPEKKRELSPNPMTGNDGVHVITKSSSDLLAMDPDKVTMQQFIRTGVAVDPSAFAKVNQIHDPADLEALLESKAGATLKYAQDNKDAILSVIKGLSSASTTV